MNNSTCIQSYQTTVFGFPTPITLTISLVMIIFGLFFNAFVILNLICQKKLSNQELYVFILSISSSIMIGPCMIGYMPLLLLRCQKLPRIFYDFLETGLQ